MSRNRTFFALLALASLVIVVFVGSATSITLGANSDNQSVYNTSRPSGMSSNVSVFATGLNNPRGLEFGPERNPYAAEGSTAGTQTTTSNQCT